MVQRRAPQKVPVPQWHPKWELGVVLSGHLGWVRSISFDPSNQWFATGSMDRTIKIWDFPKSVLGDKDCLKLTLTGHISGVRGLAVSDRHPYLFSGILIISSFLHDIFAWYDMCIMLLFDDFFFYQLVST
jgi:pleiotropic regulator 1